LDHLDRGLVQLLQERDLVDDPRPQEGLGGDRAARDPVRVEVAIHADALRGPEPLRDLLGLCLHRVAMGRRGPSRFPEDARRAGARAPAVIAIRPRTINPSRPPDRPIWASHDWERSIVISQPPYGRVKNIPGAAIRTRTRMNATSQRNSRPRGSMSFRITALPKIAASSRKKPAFHAIIAYADQFCA